MAPEAAEAPLDEFLHRDDEAVPQGPHRLVLELAALLWNRTVRTTATIAPALRRIQEMRRGPDPALGEQRMPLR